MSKLKIRSEVQPSRDEGIQKRDMWFDLLRIFQHCRIFGYVFYLIEIVKYFIRNKFYFSQGPVAESRAEGGALRRTSVPPLAMTRLLASFGYA